jgi:L-ascorbate metabolism protein UlaG (beta-lactamase superfamily)
MQVTMIGHSTVVIEIDGKRILTDPYFGLWGNPAYARTAPPAKSREQLRDVDLVLVSHNHWDHTDGRFFRCLEDDVPVIAPRRAKWLTKLRGAKTLVGMSAWEVKELGTLRITAVPASHIAATIGFIIECASEQVYFAGDTYHQSFMKQIGQRFRLGVALIPVTTFRIPMTMGERGAVRAVRDLAPAVVIPIHLGVRPRLPLLRTRHSPEGFARLAVAAGLRAEVILLREGQSWSSEQRRREDAGECREGSKTAVEERSRPARTPEEGRP